MAQRNTLGEAFGTKKAKAQIRARERNRVDIDAMKNVTGHLQDTIMQNTETLPTAGTYFSAPFAHRAANRMASRRGEGHSR